MATQDKWCTVGAYFKVKSGEAEGDRVVTRWTFSGCQTKDLPGIPEFRGHHTYFAGAFVEPLGPGFGGRIDLPKADAGLVMKSCHAATGIPLSRELDVGLVILITKERPPATISSMRYIVWYSRSYHAYRSGHEPRIPQVLIGITNYVWCPRNSEFRRRDPRLPGQPRTPV